MNSDRMPDFDSHYPKEASARQEILDGTRQFRKFLHWLLRCLSVAVLGRLVRGTRFHL